MILTSTSAGLPSSLLRRCLHRSAVATSERHSSIERRFAERNPEYYPMSRFRPAPHLVMLP